ncbi:MAG: hypothetical protein ACRC4V_03820, partial [Aeromonas veronii]
IGTSLTHIPSGYRIALLGGWLTARYAIPENKPSRTACAQMAIDRLVAHYGSLHIAMSPSLTSCTCATG